MPRPIPSQAVLRQLLHYEPETGKLFWLSRDRSFFGSDDQCARWNTRFAGTPALAAEHNGYCYGTLFGEKFFAHRVIWKWMTGSDPDVIDHISGDSTDNRWRNLRSASPSVNMRNRRMSRANKSGRMGVSFHKSTGLWRAYIGAGGHNVALGRFPTLALAIAARERAEKALNYHQNHGRTQPGR